MGLESKDSVLSWIHVLNTRLCSSGCDGAIIRLQMEVGGEEENAEEKLGNVGHRSTSAQELLEWKRRCSQGNERLDPFHFSLLCTGT